MNDLGNRLRELRVSKKMTMEEAGKAVGVSKVAVSRWEAGQRQPKPEYIKAYADFFDVPQEWIKYGYPDEYIKEIAKKELLKRGYADSSLDGISSCVYSSFFDYEQKQFPDYYPSEEEIRNRVKDLNPNDSLFVQALLEANEDLQAPFSYLNDYLVLNMEEAKSLIGDDITPDEYEKIKEKLAELLSELEDLSDNFYTFYDLAKKRF